MLNLKAFRLAGKILTNGLIISFMLIFCLSMLLPPLAVGCFDCDHDAGEGGKVVIKVDSCSGNISPTINTIDAGIPPLKQILLVALFSNLQSFEQIQYNPPYLSNLLRPPISA